ncbi:MAG: hypothetical protein M1828_003097 [Chrysothrix sp. TS-e1954]|nr:MAG: hypothetical protein M1828_003097 [Chrysothrix sp. TS-e1954]
MLEATNNIRHAAVHRLPTDAHELARMVTQALNLTRALKDTSRTQKLEVLERYLSVTIKDLELHKNSLESDLDLQLSSIDSQRRDLGVKEKEAKNAMISQDKDQTDKISSMIKESIKFIDTIDGDDLDKALLQELCK